MSQDESKTTSSTGNFTETSLRKWRLIQTAAILPLILLVVFLLKFKGSMLGTIAFLLLFIVGIILPQVYRDFIQSHLLLQDEIEKVKLQLTKGPDG